MAVEPAAVPLRAPVLFDDEPPVGFVAGQDGERAGRLGRGEAGSEPSALAQLGGQVVQIGDLLLVAPGPDLGSSWVAAGGGPGHLGRRRRLSVQVVHPAGEFGQERGNGVGAQDGLEVFPFEEGSEVVGEHEGEENLAEQVALVGDEVEQGAFGDMGVGGDLAGGGGREALGEKQVEGLLEHASAGGGGLLDPALSGSHYTNTVMRRLGS